MFGYGDPRSMDARMTASTEEKAMNRHNYMDKNDITYDSVGPWSPEYQNPHTNINRSQNQRPNPWLPPPNQDLHTSINRSQYDNHNRSSYGHDDQYHGHLLVPSKSPVDLPNVYANRNHIVEELGVVAGHMPPGWRPP